MQSEGNRVDFRVLRRGNAVPLQGDRVVEFRQPVGVGMPSTFFVKDKGESIPENLKHISSNGRMSRSLMRFVCLMRNRGGLQSQFNNAD
ncbi:hypothetical protein Bca4012_027062 [Brassica carinata]